MFAVIFGTFDGGVSYSGLKSELVEMTDADRLRILGFPVFVLSLVHLVTDTVACNGTAFTLPSPLSESFTVSWLFS